MTFCFLQRARPCVKGGKRGRGQGCGERQGPEAMPGLRRRAEGASKGGRLAAACCPGPGGHGGKASLWGSAPPLPRTAVSL